MSRVSLMRLARPVWAAGFPGASIGLPDFRSATPDLVIEPLTRGDPATAQALYRGEFFFAGTRVKGSASSIFEQPAPNLAWWRALNGFGWLADLTASRSELHRAYARALVQAWLAAQSKTAGSRDIAAMARRLISLTQHWQELRNGSSMAFRQDAARIMSRDTAQLVRLHAKADSSLDRLKGSLALAWVACSFRGLDGLRGLALPRLASDVDRFILPDGGPVTRNGEDLVDVLADLVCLRDALVSARREVPKPLHAAVERAMPMLRLLIHGDGGLAVFQGVTSPRAQTIPAILERDDVKGRTFVHASHSGFVRLSHQKVTVIADAGTGPVAMAPLAFEFSDGPHRVIVNCGFPANGNAAWMHACGHAVAHSTLAPGNPRTGEGQGLRRWRRIFRGRETNRGQVSVKTATAAEGSLLTARYDGYVADHGFIHERNLYVSAGGDDVRGEDALSCTPAMPKDVHETQFAIRFHLHPTIKATVRRGGRGVLLVLPNRTGWQFMFRGGWLSLEDSIHLCESGEALPSKQLIIRGVASGPTRVKWAFKAIGRRRKSRDNPGLDLPF